MLSNEAGDESMDIVTCSEVVSKNLIIHLISYALVIAALSQNLYYFAKFIRTIRDIMIRQRAPWIAVVQSVSYFAVIVIPFFVELMLNGEILEWEMTGDQSKITSQNQIPLSRIVTKTMLGLFRLNIAIIIPYR